MGTQNNKTITDSKLSLETKNLISKRDELHMSRNQGWTSAIKKIELNKLIKRKIRVDVEKFDFNIHCFEKSEVKILLLFQGDP